MRLWHKELIDVLPRQQLLGQWRECCCLARNLSEKGEYNHILVNRTGDYHIGHFFTYSIDYITAEMKRRGYKVDTNKFWKYFSIGNGYEIPEFEELFNKWHDERYLKQCLYNLQEKYDCKGITEEEWNKIAKKYDRFLQ